MLLRPASLTDGGASGKKYNFDLGITLIKCQIIRILELLDIGLNKSCCIWEAFVQSILSTLISCLHTKLECQAQTIQYANKFCMDAMLFYIIKILKKSLVSFQVLLTQHSRILKWQQCRSYCTCSYDHHVGITDGRH